MKDHYPAEDTAGRYRVESLDRYRSDARWTPIAAHNYMKNRDATLRFVVGRWNHTHNFRIVTLPVEIVSAISV